MINGDHKRLERLADAAIIADIAVEAQRIAAALARAETRAPDKLQLSIPEKLQSRPKPAVRPASAKPAIPAEKSEPTPADRDMGFDPYNSGSFDRKHAWSKVGKR
ncbi:MAG TPA: hypothetical protein VKG05_08270 [Steroidobacteraceae bacterium]|nr:hypothetical protein [Steroidobacteraceae bacterium]